MSGRPVAVTALAAVLSAGAAVLLGGCAIPDQRSPVQISGAGLASPPSTVASDGSPVGARIAVYFVGSDNSLVSEPRSDPSGRLPVAMADLLAGPSSGEVAAGTSSALPSGTRLLSARVSKGTANLDFNSVLTSLTGHEELLAFAQIVATATSVPGVAAVQIAVEGKAVNAPKPDGTLAQRPVTRADYASLLSG